MTARLLQHQNLLFRCALLQLLDIATTLLFLARGVSEANPLVKWSMAITHGNLAGLIVIKAVAGILAVAAVQSGRPAVVERMNRFFLFLAGWNVLAILLSFRINDFI